MSGVEEQRIAEQQQRVAEQHADARNALSEGTYRFAIGVLGIIPLIAVISVVVVVIYSELGDGTIALFTAAITGPLGVLGGLLTAK